MTLRHRFVSLGGDCQVSHQIRRATATDASLFFDWLITPIRSIKPLIERGFGDVFAPERIRWGSVPSSNLTAEDTLGNIHSWHHFHSQDADRVTETVDNLRRHGARFADILNDGAPVVFVRRWHYVDGDDKLEVALELCQFLTAIKPNSAFLYLREYDESEPDRVGNFVSCYSPKIAETWVGDDAIYDNNMSIADSIVPRS